MNRVPGPFRRPTPGRCPARAAGVAGGIGVRRSAGRRLAAGLLGLALAGCGQLGVKPWERDIHARPDMAVSEQPLTDAIEDHTYFSKEAASGGRSFGGGGCGCN